jgi:ectoine hydroxylase-related dioxygenase (phytanoyl-CoA dioxygenase family)
MHSQQITIAREQVQEYEQDGVTCVRGALSSTEVVHLIAGIDECLRQDPGSTILPSTTQRVDGFCLWTRDARIRDVTCNSHLPKLASLFLRSDKVNLFCDHLFIKVPLSPGYITPWHNDQPYWCVSGSQVVTFWIALDSVDASSGGLSFVRGSHHWDFAALSGDTFEPTPGIDENRDRYRFAQYDLLAGDMTVHHGLTVHGARGNASNRMRRGYVIRYIGEDVRYKPHRPFVVPGSEGLVSGQPLDSPAFPIVFSSDEKQ